MADPMFDPVAGLIDPKTYSDIADQWSTFLEAPGGRAALLQAGIAMSQPLSWGQSNFGAFTGALGSAGEAATRAEVLDTKRQESESKMMLREAQAGAAESRAGAAGTKLEAAQLRAQTQREAMQLRAWSDLRKGYETYRKNVETENSNILRTAPPTPIMPIEQWIQSQPSARAAAEASGLFGTQGVTQPGTYSSPQAPASTPQTAPQAPPNPADRKAGAIYQTPKGPLTWTGQGWM